MARDISFGEKHIRLSLRDVLKYDRRTREGRLARKIAEMRLAMATDDDLVDLARCEARLFGTELDCTWQKVLERLIERRKKLQSGRLWQRKQ